MRPMSLRYLTGPIEEHGSPQVQIVHLFGLPAASIHSHLSFACAAVSRSLRIKTQWKECLGCRYWQRSTLLMVEVVFGWVSIRDEMLLSLKLWMSLSIWWMIWGMKTIYLDVWEQKGQVTTSGEGWACPQFFKDEIIPFFLIDIDWYPEYILYRLRRSKKESVMTQSTIQKISEYRIMLFKT
jgi:hypothetical protein